MLDRGATASTVRDVMSRLSGILQIAVEQGHVNANAARALRKVPADAGEEVRPLPPIELERLIGNLTGRDRAIVLLAGHLGLRPLEVRAVRWADFDGAHVMIGKARTKKTARRTRTIRVPDATAHALKAWRLQAGRPGDEEPIIGDMTGRDEVLGARHAAHRRERGNRTHRRDAVHAASYARIGLSLRRVHDPRGGAASRAWRRSAR